MNHSRYSPKARALTALVLAVVSASLASCGSTETTCDDGIGCAAGASGHPGSANGGGAEQSGTSDAGGDAIGGLPNGGGNAIGGAANDAGSAGSSGTAGAPPCEGACMSPKPVCDALSNTCVECLEKADCATPKPACNTTSHACVACTANSDCTDGEMPLCDTAANQCVACLTQSDCSSAAASACSAGQCKPCTTNAECSNIPGKGVCAAGSCVQCTGSDYAACGSDAGTPLVCDTLKGSCSTSKQHSSGLCQPCLSDAQCAAGEMCVLDKLTNPATDVGYFCHWKQGDTANGAPADCFTGGRPYAGVQLNAVSIDGVTSDICSLAVSTCVARNQFRTKDCAVASVPSDAVCGVNPPADAKCAQVGASSNYSCTMTCLSDRDCLAPVTCNTGVSPPVCNLN